MNDNNRCKGAWCNRCGSIKCVHGPHCHAHYLELGGCDAVLNHKPTAQSSQSQGKQQLGAADATYNWTLPSQEFEQDDDPIMLHTPNDCSPIFNFVDTLIEDCSGPQAHLESYLLLQKNLEVQRERELDKSLSLIYNLNSQSPPSVEAELEQRRLEHKAREASDLELAL